MRSRASLSPSPPPTAPKATSSSDPGPRAIALKKIYTSALQSTLKSNSYPNFASCFPTPATYCPTALEGVWRQLNTRLEEECLKDFDKILEERKTVEGLNTLDLLVTQARERLARGVEGEETPTALHTLSAKQLGDARMHGFLVKSTDELEGKLRTTQQENQKVVDGVRAQRDEIERLVRGLEWLVSDLEGAVRALEDGIDGEGLRREVGEMEEEMKG